MVNSEAISIKLEETMQRDSVSIIEVVSFYCGDKARNITIFKFLCNGNISDGLNMPLS